MSSKNLLILYFLVFSLFNVHGLQKDETIHVLYINSYDYLMNWSQNILEGLEDVMDPENNNINLHYEALDSKEFHSEDYYESFLDYLRIKYKDYHFSIIFCSDDNAFDFLRKNHNELYPAVPIVCCGINNLNSKLLENHDTFTVIKEVPSVSSTVNLALQLHKGTEEIYIINDYLHSGRAWQKQIKYELAYLEDRIKLTYSENVPLSELQQTISSLSDKTIIILGVYYSDIDGNTSSYEKMAELIASAATVPFYTLSEFNIQKGVIGGKVISGYIQGEAIGKIGNRILKGQRPEEISIRNKEFNRFVFNYPELERFGISIGDLPEESTILNYPITIYERYKIYIWILILTFVILITSLVALILNIIKKNKADKALQELADATWEGILIHDKGIVLEINEMFSTIFGYTRKEILKTSFYDKIIDPPSLPIVKEKIAVNDRTQYEVTGIKKDGTPVPLEIRLKLIEFKGRAARVVAIRDLTDQKKTEKEHTDLQTLWTSIFENSVEGIFIHNNNRIIEKVNNSFTRITGYSKEEAIGKSVSSLQSEYKSPDLNNEIIKSIEEKGHWSGELKNRRKSGEIYSLWVSFSVLNGETNENRKLIGFFHDISDKKQQEKELKWMARYDSLTGFSNRTFFLDILSSELKASERSKQVCAVMLLNLDGLKNINNTYGFLAGDQLIKEFSIRLKSELRDEDIVSRFGGDEFAVLAPRFTERDQVNTMIKRIRSSIIKPIVIDDITIDLSVSIGISLFPDDGITARELIAKSGTALKRTKTNRKGSYSLYNVGLDKAVMKNSELEMHLQKAIALDELDIFYQPKVDPFENKIRGFEALIRWKRDKNEWIPPSVFIPISEGNGLIIEFGYYVIEKACDFISALKEKGFSDFHVGVNISAKQFSDSGFIDNLIKIVESKKIDPSHMDLEITESITASKVFNTIESLSRLSRYGFSISIDDFGTGYSSLQYLVTLPFDTIKIDKSFVDSILEVERNTTVLDTMISLAHALGKKIVAEGVETEEQKDYLMNKNCGLIQGYYYYKPMPMSEILKMIESGNVI